MSFVKCTNPTWVTNNVNSDNTSSIRNLTAERWLHCHLHHHHSRVPSWLFPSCWKSHCGFEWCEENTCCSFVCLWKDCLGTLWPLRCETESSLGRSVPCRVIWWEVRRRSSVCAPASLIACPGGVGAVFLPPPLHAPHWVCCHGWDWRHRLTSRHPFFSPRHDI